MRRNNPILQPSTIAAGTTIVALLVSLCAVGTPTAWAGKTIMQDEFLGAADEGQHFLSWEAEDYDSVVNLNGYIDPGTGELVQWNVESDPDASGGQTLRSGGGPGYNVNPAPGAAEAVYKMQFTTADYYGLFVRYKNQGYVGERDSHYFSGDPWTGANNFFTTPTAPNSKRTNWASGDPDALADPGPPPVAEYFYDFVGYMWIGEEEFPDEVVAGDVDELLEFRIGLRKGDMIVDRFIIADVTDTGPGGPGIASQTIAGMNDGTFDQTNLPLFELDAVPNSPVLTDGLAGDFDGDNDVDGADFLLWQRDLGDATSLGEWQSHFGDVAAGAAATLSAVPEPGSLLLLLAGVGLVAMKRCRRG